MNLVILLDQFPRNCYRGDSASVVFTEFDPLARDIVRAALERGVPDQEPEIRWQFSYRMWFFLPLMHSEDLSDHKKALDQYRKIVTDVDTLAADQASASADADHYRANAVKVVLADTEEAKKFGTMNLNFEQRHYDIIERFGRYPHRNEPLGREATAEEKQYLADGGETFGKKQ